MIKNIFTVDQTMYQLIKKECLDIKKIFLDKIENKQQKKYVFIEIAGMNWFDEKKGRFIDHFLGELVHDWSFDNGNLFITIADDSSYWTNEEGETQGDYDEEFDIYDFE